MTQSPEPRSKSTNENVLNLLAAKLKLLNTSESGGLLSQARTGQGLLQASCPSNLANNAGKYEVRHTTQITEDHYQLDGSVLPITVKRTDSYSIERSTF